MDRSSTHGMNTTPPAPFRVGSWWIEPALDRISRNDKSVKLEPRMMRLLCVLAEEPGRVLGAEELLDRVWPGLVVGSSSVYQAIGQLRRLLGDLPDGQPCIATVPRKGYRLVALVERGAVTPSPVGAAPLASPPPTPIAPSPSLVLPVVAPAWRWPRSGLVGLALALCVAAGLWWWPGREAGVLTVSVATWTDLTPELGSADDVDGFAEALQRRMIEQLSRVKAVRVVPFDNATARREAYRLDGSLRRSEGRVRVTLQLVAPQDGDVVWANSYDRPLSPAAEVQAELALLVVAALRTQALTLRQRDADDPQGLNAYDLYLLGRRQILLRHHEAVDRAAAYFRRALRADPGFALGHAGLADAHLARFYYQGRSLDSVTAEVEAEIERALALDPELAEAFAGRALLRLEQWRLEEARADVEHALAINPAFADAHLRLGMVHEYAGRFAEADRAYQALLALDPLHTQGLLRRCLVALRLGEATSALALCQRATDLQPELPNPWWGQALAQLAEGRWPQAAQLYEQALARAPHRADLRRELAWLQAELGDAEALGDNLARGRTLAGASSDLLIARGWWLQLRGEPQALLPALREAQGELRTADADLRTLAASLAWQAGDVALARQLLPAADARSADAPGNLHLLGWGFCEPCIHAQVLRAAGRPAEALQWEERADAWLRRLAAGGYQLPGLAVARANLAAGRGQRAAALAALESAVDRGWRGRRLLRTDPAFASLQAEPRFRRLMLQLDQRAASRVAAVAPSSRSGQTPTR